MVERTRREVKGGKGKICGRGKVAGIGKEAEC